MGDSAPIALLPEVAAKYDLLKITPGTYCFPGFGQIDLTTVNLKRADKLVATGFVWLVAKAPAPAAPQAAKNIQAPGTDGADTIKSPS